MTSETELLQLALAAYEAAVEPQLWPRFLQLYNDVVSSDSVVLQIHDLGRNQSEIVAAFGLSSPSTQSHNEHYSRLNVWRNQGRARYVAGTVYLDQEQCPRPFLDSSELSNDHLRRAGGDYSMGAVISRTPSHAPTLTALRGRRKGAYSETERKVVQLLLPYLARAWRVYETLELFATGRSLLDRLAVGVVFLGASGAAIHWNRSAEEIFGANDGFSLRTGFLWAQDRRADAQLRQALDHVRFPGRLRDEGAVAAPRTSGRRAYQVIIAPLRDQFRQFVGALAPVAVALITDPERPGPANLDLLVQLYGLTGKEAQMAAKLSEARSIEQAAEEMGITYQTARTHLRRIFTKTGTSRQAELVLLLARLPVANRVEATRHRDLCSNP